MRFAAEDHVEWSRKLYNRRAGSPPITVARFPKPSADRSARICVARAASGSMTMSIPSAASSALGGTVESFAGRPTMSTRFTGPRTLLYTRRDCSVYQLRLPYGVSCLKHAPHKNHRDDRPCEPQ